MNAQDITSPEVLDEFIRRHVLLHDELEGRDGATPLEVLADDVSLLEPNSSQTQIYNTTVLRLVEQIPYMGQAEVTKLVKFILTVKFLPQGLATLVPQLLANRRIRLQPSKRADVFSLMRRLGLRLLPEQIAGDSVIREHRPWLWFDLAWSSSPDVALAALPELALRHDFFESMLTKVVRLWQSSPDAFPDFVSRFNSLLKPAQQHELNRYLHNFKLPIPAIKMANEVELDRIASAVFSRTSFVNSLQPA